MSIFYKDAQIYLTTCTHPKYLDVRYLGLDTKKSPTYYGSSTVLKWIIGNIGKSYFKKEILDTVSGDMATCCALEQIYILEHDAVRNPAYLNMSGGRQRRSTTNNLIDFKYSMSSGIRAKEFTSEVIEELASRVVNCTFQKNAFANKTICMMAYAFLRYEQTEFEYSVFELYGLGSTDAVEEVLSCLSLLGYVEKYTGSIEIRPEFILKIPENLTHEDFTATLREL